MALPDFSTLSDHALIDEAFNERLGSARAHAIAELADRSLKNPALLDSACKAISSDRGIGFHKRAPLGWFGADQIYLSGQAHAISVLLSEMKKWAPVEQEDLVRHWAGKQGIKALTDELKERYGWEPGYELAG